METVSIVVSDGAEIADSSVIVVGDSLDTIFRANYARLVRALTVVCGHQELAADAVQEAFVKAHLHWRNIESYDDPVGWIRRVAINKLRDEGRRVGRKQRAVERLQIEERPPTVEWAHEGDIGALLATLPRQQRLALALFYVEGLSVAEVASTLRITDGAVKFHLHQGRERLRAAHTAEQRTSR